MRFPNGRLLATSHMVLVAEDVQVRLLHDTMTSVCEGPVSVGKYAMLLVNLIAVAS